jgi:hypothetical protein
MGCVAGHEFFSTTNRHCTVTPCAPFATVEGSWNEQREQRLGNPCVECPSLNGADNMQAAFTDASNEPSRGTDEDDRLCKVHQDM